MTGSAVTTAVATTSTVSEITTIAAIAVAFVLLVLILTTTSFAEPFLVLAGLGVAIIINSGSNLMFGGNFLCDQCSGKYSAACGIA